ncbi:peptidoglycan D,D-transpeptidase FtsI family protein [Dokdonella fugitiva]|jgi:cell division protein FtsI (penicillin-binding protein 3)|uniref:Peptidoglycan D,D-transpeptidase FtsI n=1 Tax=Dokdonella fugitiva TaxID=328517 RepID=A0A4R2IDI5_9GAMM|nr:penicillin-binding protein 2 [Dokdonella fugitiva]MBA8882529.1 cell division protein FtsI (penicillin-binding protein 3) [Dokdonella fugitiva]TCO42673.1 cell division protein FtsI (penicillin-binding protein 3) [Dokdonella fugitiva]
MSARAKPNPRTRLYAVLAMLGLASSALVVRAVDLQVVRKDFYQEQGDARYLRDIDIPVSRGTIFDRNGEPLAVSTPVESIWANPKELLEHADRIGELARATGLDEESLRQRLAERSDREFYYVKRHLNPDDAQAVLALGIPGVSSQREFRRYYPSGEVIAHVLGFTNIDDAGQEGLELAFDAWLAGEKGVKRVIRDRLGHEVENVELVREARPGKDLTISIDRRIQYLAYRELKAALVEHHASSGSMVILDVPTGEVLAMVNQPSFNPNARGNVDPAYRRNRAATDVVEPGSTVKAFTIATALESGKWKPHTPIDTSPGTYTLYGHTISDVHNKGLIDVTGVITYSSNVGAAKIAATLSRDEMYDVFHRFGFGEVTGCGFPGESPGNLPIAKNWGPVEQATIAYGYGLSVTPLQLAQGYAALANGGRLRPPTFVKGGQAKDRAVIDPQIAATVRGMLETVVHPPGGGIKAAITNYRVAGKTGTSRTAVGGGYQKKYISLFAGMVPASAPRLVGVVVIHDPQGAYYGALVSAPVFSKVMDGALRLLDVPPDDVQNWYTASPDSGHTVRMARQAPDGAQPEPDYAEGVPE